MIEEPDDVAWNMWDDRGNARGNDRVESSFLSYHSSLIILALNKRVKAMLHTLMTRVMRVFNTRDKRGYFEMESSMKMGE